MSKLIVLGFFGYQTNQIDGQTIKTRSIYTLLKSKEAELKTNVRYFDTQTLRSSRLNIIRMFFSLLASEKICYLGAHKNLKYVFPFIFILCKLLKKDIHFIVVGGWLSEFLNNKPLHRCMLKKIKGIYPQTDSLCEELQVKHNLMNVYKLNNFRITDHKNGKASNVSELDKKRLVFMARVHPKKGLGAIFKLKDQIVRLGINNVVIDIFGPIYKPYKKEFFSHLRNGQGVVHYKGVLQPSDIYETLSEYDLMLFPTRYYTEGFPGTVLDAYISGVPVVVSDWKYAKEFVAHGVSGLISEFDDDDCFVRDVLNVLQDEDCLMKLRQGAISHSLKYSPEAAWCVLKNNI